jgi:hypothetical protein
VRIRGQRDELGGAGCRRRPPGSLFVTVGHGGSFRQVDDAF